MWGIIKTINNTNLSTNTYNAKGNCKGSTLNLKEEM